MGAKDLEKIARRVLTAYGVGRGTILIVAVSGGPDSMVLLDSLRILQKSLNYKLIPVHVNHGLRKKAKADQTLVEQYAKKYQLPLEVIKLSIKAKTGIEEKAREHRYAALRKVAKENKADYILTAHTANDQAETVVFNFLRGSGLRGMGGMKELSGGILRPLLTVFKKDVESYAKKHKVPFAVDETNIDTKFTRNRIRYQLLPEMLNYNPKLLDQLNRNAYLFQAAENVIRQISYHYLLQMAEVSKTRLVIDISRLREVDSFLQMEILKRGIETLDEAGHQDLTSRHFEEMAKLLKASGIVKPRRIFGKLFAAKSYDKITLTKGGHSSR